MTDHDDPREDVLAERLRRALAAEADRVEPVGDGLNRIRGRVAGRRARARAWWHGWPAPGLALGAAAVAGAVTAGVLATGGGDEAGRDLPATVSSSPGSAVTSPPAGTLSSPATTAPPPRALSTPASPQPGGAGPGGTPVTRTADPDRTMTATVYYAGGGGGSARALYRERQRVPFDRGVVRVAVQRLLGGTPADPDYENLWPAGTVLGARIDGTRIVLDLSTSVARRTASAADVRLGVQQLVYTATEAARRPEATVELRIAGAPVSSLWGHPLGSLSRAGHAGTLAPVWITEPADGGRVRPAFTVRGEATVFEATVNWEVRRGGQVVREGFATAEAGAPGRGAWRQRLTLDPGSYELQAFEVSAKDGSRLAVDSKRITVE